MVKFRESTPDTAHLFQKEGREQRHKEFVKKLQPLANFTNTPIETMIDDNKLFGIDYEVYVNQGREQSLKIMDIYHQAIEMLEDIPEFVDKPNQQVLENRFAPDCVVRLRALQNFVYRLPRENKPEDKKEYQQRCEHKLEWLKNCSRGFDDCHRLQSYHNWTDQDFAKLFEDFNLMYTKTLEKNFMKTKKILVTLFILGFLIIAIDANAKSNCKPKIKQKDSYYKGKMIDSHFHMPSPTDSLPKEPELGRNVFLKQIHCNLKAEGTSKVFAYFPVYEKTPGGTEQFIDVVEKIYDRYPNQFVNFIMPPSADDNPPTVGYKKINEAVNGRWYLFQGFGEIGLYKLDNRKAKEYPPNAPILNNIYKHIVKKHNLMVSLHPGRKHRKELKKVLKKYPDTNFIIHGEEIETKHGVLDFGSVGDLLAKFPNLYFTVNQLYGNQFLLRPKGTKKEFFDGLRDYAPLLEIDKENWKTAIEAHPNQFLWGTDRGDAIWTYDKKVGKKLVDYGRTFIAELDPAVQKKVAYKNAQKLIQQSQK